MKKIVNSFNKLNLKNKLFIFIALILIILGVVAVSFQLNSIKKTIKSGAINYSAGKMESIFRDINRIEGKALVIASGMSSLPFLEEAFHTRMKMLEEIFLEKTFHLLSIR